MSDRPATCRLDCPNIPKVLIRLASGSHPPLWRSACKLTDLKEITDAKESEKITVTFFTTGNVAKACGVSVVTVETWIKQGRLRAVRTPGGHYRVPARDFDIFRAQYRFPDDAERILVVDDDPAIVDLILECARSARPEATLEAAANGYEALLKVGTYHPQVVVLDVFMPGLDGFEVCRQIKEGPETRSTKVLVVSAHADETVRRQAAAVGAEGFVAKPFEIDRLVDCLRQLFGGR